MFTAVSVDEAREIAGRFDIFRSIEQLQREVDIANQSLNKEFPESSRKCCEGNPFYMAYHRDSYTARVVDPREILAYWYVQEEGDNRIEGEEAVEFEDRAYGIDE